MKKLRLLITEECNRNCAMCCNKNYNLAKLRIETKFSQYDEIILTGGEPMLEPLYLQNVITYIRYLTHPDTKIYLQTAKVDDIKAALTIFELVDGVTVTLHALSDLRPFLLFDDCISDYGTHKKSLRLNYFEDIPVISVSDKWTTKQIKWVKDCPLPENEVFKRFAFVDTKEESWWEKSARLDDTAIGGFHND